MRKSVWTGGDPSLVYVIIRPSETSLFEGKDLTEFPFPTQVTPAIAETTSEYHPNYMRDALKEFLEACMLPDDLPQKLLTTKDFLDATRSNATLMAQFLQWLGDRNENSKLALATDSRVEAVKDFHQVQRPKLTKRPRIRGRSTSTQKLIGSDKKRKASADSFSTLKAVKRGKY
jgi:hypothetical protein